MSITFRLLKEQPKESFYLGQGEWYSIFPKQLDSLNRPDSSSPLKECFETPEQLASQMLFFFGDLRDYLPEAERVFLWAGESPIRLVSDAPMDSEEIIAQYPQTGSAIEDGYVELDLWLKEDQIEKLIEVRKQTGQSVDEILSKSIDLLIKEKG